MHEISLTQTPDHPIANVAGLPAANAVVEIWQCDDAGHYHHPGDGGKADARFKGLGAPL